MQTFAEGLGFPEGPILMPGGGFMIVEMAQGRGWIASLSADGARRDVLVTTGRPNGLAQDRNGIVWIAETAQHAVLKLAPDYSVSTFATQCDGRPFMFLNDLAFAPNGDLYVTDSGVEENDLAPQGVLNPAYRSLAYDGRIYRIDVKSAEVQLIDRGLQFCNGIAFGPDSALYVTETLTGNIYRYDYSNGRVSGRRETFTNVIETFDAADLKGPDGMKFADDGRLFAAVFGQGDITVAGRDGSIVDRIATNGRYPTNLVFGPPGTHRVFVTEMETGTMQMFDAGVDGLPLYG